MANNNKQSLEIHSITFLHDVRLTEIQILSLNMFFDLRGFEKYKLIINDNRASLLSDHFRKFILEHTSEEFGSKVEISIANSSAATGWRNQQLIKLFSVAESKSDWVLMLDAKNHFLRPIGKNKLLDENRALIHHAKPPGKQSNWLNRSLAFFDLPENDGMALPTITPYMLGPQIVREMLEEICRRLDITSEEICIDDGPLKGATEFFLYYAYMKYKDIVGKYYVISEKKGETIFTRWPTDPAITKRYLGECISGKHYYLGVHRRRLPDLSKREVRLLDEVWFDLNLPEKIDYYLAEPTYDQLKS